MPPDRMQQYIDSLTKCCPKDNLYLIKTLGLTSKFTENTGNKRQGKQYHEETIRQS